MPPSTCIPSLLQPYVHLAQDDSHILITSALGASANWLLIRFLYDALNTVVSDGGGEGHNVVLVSWMREYDFWKQEARKGAGLDLERLRRDGRFAFVDGLGGMCLDAVAQSRAQSPQNTSSITPVRPIQTLPLRAPQSGTLPGRGPPAAAPAVQRDVTTANAPAPTASTSKVTPGHYTLDTLDIAHLKTTISTAVSSFASPSSPAQRKTLLVLDNPDLLLALNPATTPSSFTSCILSLHTLPTVSHILTHLQADTPLLSLSTPPQPLELSHHNLLVKCAHMSRWILGVRVLDTGVARDVSGVVRITEQKAGWVGLGLEDTEKQEEDARGKGKEFLYQVKGDGSVKVFERGAGGDG